MCVISMVSVSVVSYLNNVMNLSIPLLIYAGSFPLWIMFFGLGIYLSKRQRDYNLKLVLVLVIIGLGLSYLESYYLNTHYHGGFGIKPSVFIYSFSVILFLFSSKLERAYSSTSLINRAIQCIGDHSFGVYLIHCYLISAISKLNLDFWGIKVLLVIIASVCIVKFGKRQFPSMSSKYLGFQ